MFLSVFSDELGMDVTRAVPIIKSWGVNHVDFRGRVYKKGIEALDDQQLKDLRTLVDDHGMTVGCLQTSLCKVHLPDEERQKKEAEKLEGIIRAAEALDCPLVRAFHYWQPGKEGRGALAVQPDALQRVLDIFGPIAERAKEANLVMAFENCGVQTEEVFTLLDALDVPEWGMAWDVSNTWDCDERREDEDAYIDRMVKIAKCVHVKSRGSVLDLNGEMVPYSKVISACYNLGMTGPVSAETHNPDKSMSNEERTHQVIEALRRAWPAAASQSLAAKASPSETVIRGWADDPVGFLVVGLGMGHGNSQKVAKTSGCKLVAVADLVEERAKRTGEQLDVPYGTDFRKWLDDDKVDVVYVVTETGNHGAVAMQALEAGKHVLTTKPMEATLAACDRMIQLAEEKGLILAVDFNRRFTAGTLTLKRNMDDGVLGRMLSAECSTKILRTMDYFRQNGGWRGTRKLDGGGVLSNQVIHHIDELVFTLGVPAKVRADVWTQNHEIEAEDLGIATWLYEDGSVVNFHATTCFPQPTWYLRIELTGAQGAYSYASGGMLDKPVEKWYLDGSWTDKAPTIVKSEWLNAADNIAAALRTGAPLVCDGRDGRRSQSVLDAMYRSAYDNGGAWTDVNAG